MAERSSTGKKASVKDFMALQEPVITEKASMVGSGSGGVVFKVGRHLNKGQIKAAVEKVFGVEVAKVRTCNFVGKMKRTIRTSGRTAAFKKAYITLKPGHKIDIVEGI